MFALLTELTEFLNTNCTTWLAASSPLSSFACVWENHWEGRDEISASHGFSRKCQALFKAQKLCSWMDAVKNSSSFLSAPPHSLPLWFSMNDSGSVYKLSVQWLALSGPRWRKFSFHCTSSAQTGALLSNAVSVNLVLSAWRRNECCPVSVQSCGAGPRQNTQCVRTPWGALEWQLTVAVHRLFLGYCLQSRDCSRWGGGSIYLSLGI